jgi:hypothetical protein
MNTAARKSIPRWLLLTALCGLLMTGPASALPAADETQGRMSVNFSEAAPRKVEELTKRSVTRDYGRAWDNLAAAMSSNAPELLNGYFTGTAKSTLAEAIASQKGLGIQCNYGQPIHKLDAVFYSPEGDVMELHDTVELDLRLTADGKTLHAEHVTLHYVVLMTPAADRWLVRQLQGVAGF